MLRGLARTFQLVPLTSAPQITSLVGGAEQVFATIFAAALEIAAPVLIALLITDVAFGVVSRVVPQLNVFAVGFPAKVARRAARRRRLAAVRRRAGSPISSHVSVGAALRRPAIA